MLSGVLSAGAGAGVVHRRYDSSVFLGMDSLTVNIYTWTLAGSCVGLTPATSAPGLDSPLPHHVWTLPDVCVASIRTRWWCAAHSISAWPGHTAQGRRRFVPMRMRCCQPSIARDSDHACRGNSLVQQCGLVLCDMRKCH